VKTTSCSSRRQLVGGLIATLMLGMVGCGSDSAPADPPNVQAQAALAEGFNSFHEAIALVRREEQAATEEERVPLRAESQLRLQSALTSTERSDALYPTQEAELLKAFLQIALGQLTWAHLTLELLDTRYPGSEDELLHAVLLAKEAGDPAQILAELQESLADSWSGLEETTWWAVVEQAPSFEHFRASPQYAELLALKPSAASMLASAASAAAATCRDNVTAVRAKWFGMQYLFKHDDVQGLIDGLDVGAVVGLTLPLGLDVVFGVFFGGEAIAVGLVDHGCGVIVTNVWLTPVYVPTSQK